MTVSISAPNELVMLMSSGTVFRFSIDQQKAQSLFSVKSNISYDDGGFDILAPSTIYTLDSIVVIVNDFKRHGFVHYPDKYHALHLWRQDYYAEISCYPIALFKNEEGVPHMIYGEAWNHIQIMNLDTRQILTASKSLIEENAEERHVEFYKNQVEYNKLPWPRPYDYFFGKLEMSPDNKLFLSAGWAWGSRDAYNIYEVDHFIHNHRIADNNIGYWEHNNRAVCWIDYNTVAIVYNPYDDEEEGAAQDSPYEIRFYKVSSTNAELERMVQVEGLDLSKSSMYFNRELNAIVIISDTVGVALFSLDGKILFHDEQLRQYTYHSDLNLFIITTDKSIVVQQITHV